MMESKNSVLMIPMAKMVVLGKGKLLIGNNKLAQLRTLTCFFAATNRLHDAHLISFVKIDRPALGVGLRENTRAVH